MGFRMGSRCRAPSASRVSSSGSGLEGDEKPFWRDRDLVDESLRAQLAKRVFNGTCYGRSGGDRRTFPRSFEALRVAKDFGLDLDHLQRYGDLWWPRDQIVEEAGRDEATVG